MSDRDRPAFEPGEFTVITVGSRMHVRGRLPPGSHLVLPPLPETRVPVRVMALRLALRCSLIVRESAGGTIMLACVFHDFLTRGDGKEEAERYEALRLAIKGRGAEIASLLNGDVPTSCDDVVRRAERMLEFLLSGRNRQ